MRFLLLFVILTLSPLSMAKSSTACDQVFAGDTSVNELSDLSPFQRSVKEYIDEVRSNKNLMDGVNWQTKIVVKSPYVKETIGKLHSSLQILLNNLKDDPSIDPSVLKSTTILQNYTADVLQHFEQRGVKYNAFLRLSEIYTWHFEFLSQRPDIREGALMEASENMGEAKLYKNSELGIPQEIASTDADWVLLADTGHLQRYLESPFLVPVLFGYAFYAITPKLNLSTLGRKPFVLVPTFEALDFEPMIWAQANRAGFLGLSAADLHVDSTWMGPRSFFEHDLTHYFSTGRSNYVDPWLWKRLNTAVRELRKSNHRMADLQMAYLFYIVHERYANLDCRYNFSKLVRQNRLDLAAGLVSYTNEPPPSTEEIQQALKSLKKTMRRFCWY